MQSRPYPLLLTLSLVALAGCSTDEQPATSSASPVASASPAGPVLPGRQPAAPPAPGLATCVAPAAVSPGKQAAVGEKRGLIRYSGSCTCLPDAPDLSASSWPSREKGSTPDSVNVSAAPLGELPVHNDLAAFCAQAAPQAQIFQLQPGRDTVMLGQQGTRLVVPGRAFDVPPGSGPVRLELQEFYSTPDILLAGLSTATGPDLLETGGMLHLQATAAGQPVALRPGTSILLQLPTRERKPGMQLYQGVATGAHRPLDWQLPAGQASVARAAGKRKATSTPKGDRWPCLAKGNGTLQPAINQLLPLSAADLMRVAHLPPTTNEERRLLRLASWKKGLVVRRKKVRYIVSITLLIDSSGVIRKAYPEQGDTVLGDAIAAAVRQLPPLRPASYLSSGSAPRRRPAAARGRLQILYTRDGQRLASIEWLEIARPELPGQDAQRSRAEFARQFNDGTTPLALTTGLYYELAAGGLGWINCDRLLEPGPRIEFAVQAPSPATVVSLVFKGQRSILASSRTEGSRVIFMRVPSGAPATVVALRREKGITYLATHAVSLSPDAPLALEFHPVTLAELRTELARL